MVWSSHLFKNFPQFFVIYTVKGFRGVNEEVDIFLEFPCFLYNPTDVGNLISDSSAFSKYSLYIWKCSVHILLKLSSKNFEHYFASILNEHNSSFFLQLFLCSSSVAYQTLTDLGGSSSVIISFCFFGTVHEVLKARILEYFAILFSSGPCFVRFKGLTQRKRPRHWERLRAGGEGGDRE